MWGLSQTLLMAGIQNTSMPQDVDETGRFVPYCNKIKGRTTVEPLVHYNSSDYYQLPKTKGEDILNRAILL